MKCHFKDCVKKVNEFCTTKCSCDYLFCKKHRLPFEHECVKLQKIKKDHKTGIAEKNPVITKDHWNLHNW